MLHEGVLDATWPLTPDRRALVVRMSELVRRFGTGRFIATHVVRADVEDFPEPWQPTVTAVHALLYRLFWHAHLEPEVTLDVHLQDQLASEKMLTRSEISFASAKDGIASFHLGALGNDDVAGLLATEVGLAFVELAPGTPFRDAATEATPSDGSLAAIYLGLGVLVANAASYRRTAQRWHVRTIVTEEYIESVGGFDVGDAMMLVAIQDIVRDDASGALDTLHAPQREWLETWRAVLDPHEAELRALLELDDRRDLPSRADAPRRPPPRAEIALTTKANAGRITFRVRTRKTGVIGLGAFAGGAAAYVVGFGWIVAPVLLLAGAVLGFALSGTRFECSEPECRAPMAMEVALCPRCGGSIAETIDHPILRLERREQLEAGSPDPETDTTGAQKNPIGFES